MEVSGKKLSARSTAVPRLYSNHSTPGTAPDTIDLSQRIAVNADGRLTDEDYFPAAGADTDISSASPRRSPAVTASESGGGINDGRGAGAARNGTVETIGSNALCSESGRRHDDSNVE